MAAIGGITVIIGAALAFVQDDIKKVLAYSTISQLGYMVMALGVGAWTAAVFHLFTHAFFKADLFLGAGSVSHSGSHHSFDMKKDMGGLRKYMPQTYKTFVIGTLALAGIFPLAGFWSKDEILVNAGHNGYKLFLVVGLDRCVHDRGLHDALRLPHVPRRVPRSAHGAARSRPRSRRASSTTPDQTPPGVGRRTTPRCTRRTRATGSSRAALGPVVLRGVRGLLELPALRQVREVVPAALPAAFAEIAAPGRVQPDPRDRLGR